MPSFSDITFVTSRMVLRPFVESDAPSQFKLRSNEDVCRFTGYFPWTTVDSSVERIKKDQHCMRTGEYLRLAMVRLADQQLMGSCTLFDFDEENRRASIGYELHPDYWKHGYVREAMLPLINYAFNTLNFNRLDADVEPENLASVRVLEFFGFKREGFLREAYIKGGVKSDSLLFGLLQADWK